MSTKDHPMSYTRTTLCPMCKGTRWIVLSAPGERIEAPCIMCNVDGEVPYPSTQGKR